MMSGEPKEPLHKYSIINSVWNCEEDPGTCDVDEFKADFEADITDNMDLKIFESELVKIGESMREENALRLCTILEFKRPEGPEIIALCAMDEDVLELFE